MRVAIAGAGLMGRWHAWYARQCGASVCAIADPHRPERDLKRCFPSAAVFPEVEALLASLKPHVLHICTPAATHESIIETALDAGVHIIVEKPLAATAETTGRLLQKAADRRLLLMPVHQFVFQDGAMRATISLERIGRPLHVDAFFCSAGSTYLREEELDDLVADILPHPLSLLDSFFPRCLGSIEWTHLRSANGEWRISGVTEHMSVSILVSLHGRPTEASLRITGTQGSIHLNLFHGFATVNRGHVSRTHKITAPFAGAARTLLAAGGNLTRRVLTREPAYPGLRRLIGLFYTAVREHSSAPLSAQHAIAVAAGRDRLRNAACGAASSGCAELSALRRNL